MTIGEKIKERRISLGLTQDDLAKRVGYKSRSSINKIELSRELPLRKIEQLATALNVDPSYLMGWKDEESDYEQAGRDAAQEIIDQDLLDAFRKTQDLPNGEKQMVIDIVSRILDGRQSSSGASQPRREDRK